jgi:hypothetical protein
MEVRCIERVVFMAWSQLQAMHQRDDVRFSAPKTDSLSLEWTKDTQTLTHRSRSHSSHRVRGVYELMATTLYRFGSTIRKKKGSIAASISMSCGWR